MSDNKKKRIDKGFVPQKPPKRPTPPKIPIEPAKGYVSPRSPKKPPSEHKMPE
jgi:hypothetical protein